MHLASIYPGGVSGSESETLKYSSHHAISELGRVVIRSALVMAAGLAHVLRRFISSDAVAGSGHNDGAAQNF